MRGQPGATRRWELGLRLLHGLLAGLTMLAYLKTVEVLPEDLTPLWSSIATLALAAVFFAPLALVFRWMNRLFDEGRPRRSP